MEIELRGYQEKAIQYIVNHKGVALVKIPCGGGKTLVSLYLLKRYPRIGKTLFITPSSVKHQFAREYGKVFPEKRVVVISGKVDQGLISEIRDADACFINYDILFNKDSRNEKGVEDWTSVLKQMKFRMMVCDECHKVKNSDAKRTESVQELSYVIPFKILMSATPITNTVMDIYSQIKILDPSFNMCYTYFEHEFCPKVRRMINVKKKTADGYKFEQKEVWVNGRSKNIDRLRSILSNYVYSVKDAEVYAHLAEYTHIPVEIDVKMNNQIRLMNDRFADVQSIMEARESLMNLRKAVGLVKIPQVVEWVNDWLDGNKSKLVVFTYHREVTEKLQEMLKGSVKFYGGMSDKEKQSAVKEFTGNENCRVIVCNMNTVTGLDGLNTVSNVCVYAEETSSATDAEQSRGRIRRTTSTADKYLVYHLLGHEIEKIMLEAQDTKRISALLAIEGREISERDTLEYILKRMRASQTKSE